MRRVRVEMVALQTHQDSLFREMQRQNRMLLDTIKAGYSAQLDAQGQTSHRFQELEQQLGRTEAIVNQLHGLIAQLSDRLDQQSLQQAPSGGVSSGSRVGTEVEGMYELGLTKLAEGAFTTARITFEAIINQYPQDPRAPDAQFQIGETYAKEGNAAQAIEELRKVESNWPNSPRAPAALYRAGFLAEEGQDVDLARELYELIRRRYPGSDEFRLAEERLRQIGR
ncbi:MAG: tetratricopeptide repeat protein [Longimicrobiales bacterium]